MMHIIVERPLKHGHKSLAIFVHKTLTQIERTLALNYGGVENDFIEMILLPS